MNDISFEQPTEAPVAANTAPYVRYIQYKSGKTPEAFAKNAKPEDVKAGFSYYDKEAGQSVRLDKFTACVVAVVSGVTGTVRNGDYYDNYFSNYVFDTRIQVLNVRQRGIQKVLYSGLYNDIKGGFPQGVGYTQFLIAYIVETKEVVSIELTTGLSAAIQRCIAETTGTSAKKVNLFHLCDLSTQFWCFSFLPEFEKRNKEGEAYAGKGEMYFMPKIQAFVVRAEKSPESVEMLNSIAYEVRMYIDATQERIKAKTDNEEQEGQTPVSEPQPLQQKPVTRGNASEAPFPPEDITSYPENGENDDLPF